MYHYIPQKILFLSYSYIIMVLMTTLPSFWNFQVILQLLLAFTSVRRMVKVIKHLQMRRSSDTDTEL